MKNPLKIKAILCINSIEPPAWISSSIESIDKQPFFDIVGFVIIPTIDTNHHFTNLLLKLIKIIKKPNYKNLYSLPKKINTTLKNKAPYYLLDQTNDKSIHLDLSLLPSCNLIINYTPILIYPIQNHQLEYGVWYHVFNNEGNLNTDQVSIKETFLGLATLNTELRVQLKNSSQSLLLYSASTCPSHNSVEESNHFIHWRASLLVGYALNQLINQPVISALNTSTLALKNNKPFNSFSLITLLIRYLSKKIYLKIAHFNRIEQWVLLYQFSEDNNPYTNINIDNFTLIKPPTDRFWADPHVVFENNRYYIFFEELCYTTWKGHLSIIEITKEGSISPTQVILNKDYHLSYPHIFNYKGSYYMIPETCQNQTIELYRCTDFPHQWEFVMNIMENVDAVDTTLYFDHNRCWLFTSIKTNKEAPIHDEFSIFYSDHGFKHNQWIPHPQNPITSDVSNARPAGKIFKHGNKVYRPSQDCSKHYGYAYNLNEIKILNSDVYEEKLIQKVPPDEANKIVATHTYNHVKGLTVSDGILIRKKKRWLI